MNTITIAPLTETIFGKELITLLAQLCVDIQKEFDISPILLDRMINEKKFVKYSQFLHEQCYSEMVTYLNSFKQSFFDSLNQNLHINNSCEQYEKCGHLIKTHHNGYIQYCNLHKYLHPHFDMVNSTGILSDVDHVFVTKTEDQLTKEYYYSVIHTIYQNFINKLHHLLKLLFAHYIKQSCDIQSIKIDNLRQIEELLNKMKDDVHLFKNKVIYEQIDVSSKQESEKRDSHCYIKIYLFRGDVCD